MRQILTEIKWKINANTIMLRHSNTPLTSTPHHPDRKWIRKHRPELTHYILNALNFILSYIYIYAAKSLQSCSTLCSPIDGSPSGSPVPGILQARPLEWVAISFSNAWKWKVKVKSLSRIQLLVTPWTVAYQAPPSMGFSRQEYLEWVAMSFSRRPRLDSWVRKIPWRRKWQPTPVFLPGESHGQRSLAGYSPWGH